MRTISEGPTQLPDQGDSYEWRWKISSESGAEESIRFAVTGSAGCSAIEGLPRRVRQAIESEGRSEVERILDVAEVPMLIEVGTLWVTVHHREGTWSRGW